nr:YfiR family protein [uncultured Pseudomonas sp.]
MDVAVFSTRQGLRSGLLRLSLHLLLLSTPCLAQPEVTLNQVDQRAKNVTQVVLGILSYARWPIEPAYLQLCVVGPTEYADDLLKGATQANGRALQVRRVMVTDPSLIERCNALYLGKLSPEDRRGVFEQLTGQAVLSISEQVDPCSLGSLFCLRVGEEQVSFEVNLDSVARSGVRIHPRVLQLSQRRGDQA